MSYLKIAQNKIFTSYSAWLFANIILTLFYFFTARLVHNYALHPGFATPVWPSSGIALAFIYIFGYSLWPGVLLGSFFHNILVFSSNLEFETLTPVFAAFGIGAGAALQAIVGAYLLKRYIASPYPIDRVKNVTLFILFGLLSAVINSTIGNLIITSANAIPWSRFFQSWWTWWIGDAAGILVFASLILAWVYHPITKIGLWSFLKASCIFILTLLVFKIAIIYPVMFFIIPLLIWVCFLFNTPGGTLYLALVTGALVGQTSLGYGQFALRSMNESILILEIFTGSLLTLALYLCASLNERSESDELLKVYNRSLEQTVEKRTQDLKKRLSQLQDMQKIISDQEKLAYLGELTAGIAHEIKDPLHSITLHAGKGKELTESLISESSKEINSILDLIQEHFKKIAEYSKKSSEFAQGLIYHSKDKPGYFQMVDINELCSEYLKLASHEMYSTDPWHDVQIKMDFDPSIGLISAIPQDISVVLFNLLSNANRSVHEKKKRLGEEYQPKVLVKTQNLGNRVAIIIRDNGDGIAPSIKDKLFTPFFSTKPPGKGLGLGLSSAQEIIADKHEGEIKVDSVEGEYCEFKIILPRYRQVKLNEEL